MISFTHAHSPMYASVNKDRIALLVKFDHFAEEVEFIASLNDVESHGQELFKRAASGEFGPIGDYVVPTISEADRKAMFKTEVTRLVEAKAVELDFDSVAEAMTYCDEPSVPEYQQKAIALRKWRSLVWAWYDAAVASGADADVATMESMPSFS